MISTFQVATAVLFVIVGVAVVVEGFTPIAPQRTVMLPTSTTELGAFSFLKKTTATAQEEEEEDFDAGAKIELKKSRFGKKPTVTAEEILPSPVKDKKIKFSFGSKKDAAPTVATTKAAKNIKITVTKPAVDKKKESAAAVAAATAKAQEATKKTKALEAKKKAADQKKNEVAAAKLQKQKLAATKTAIAALKKRDAANKTKKNNAVGGANKRTAKTTGTKKKFKNDFKPKKGSETKKSKLTIFERECHIN